MSRYRGYWTTGMIFIGWVVSLSVLWFATHNFQTEADSMNFGWVIIPGVAACAAVIGRKRRLGLKTSKEWLLLLPSIACLLLAAMNMSVLRELLSSPSKYSLTKFQYGLYAFLLIFIGWIVAYPFDQIFVPLHAGARKLLWTSGFTFGGLALCWYIGSNTVNLANGSWHPVRTHELQLWIQEANFLLSAFVLTRLLLPVTAQRVLHTIGDIGNDQ
jgi:hypothetical protein